MTKEMYMYRQTITCCGDQCRRANMSMGHSLVAQYRVWKVCDMNEEDFQDTLEHTWSRAAWVSSNMVIDHVAFSTEGLRSRELQLIGTVMHGRHLVTPEFSRKTVTMDCIECTYNACGL